MTGFESVAKGSEEARAGFDPRHFSRAIYLAVIVGLLFYVIVCGVVAYVFPWRTLVVNHFGTDAAFERAFGSRAVVRVIFAGAFLSLLKVFNGNFVAASRLIFAIGRRRFVHPLLGTVHPRYGTPAAAIALLAIVTAAASLLGDAVLVPISDVGSLASGIGWSSACIAYLARMRERDHPARGLAAAGAVVSVAIVAMKIVPAVPGSFSAAEWIAFVVWLAIGLAFWTARPRRAA
jgi:amino acid transporter